VSEGGSLQFDRAERPGRPSGTACAVCQQPVAASYYEINGRVTCQRCRGQVLAAWNRGSPRKRFAKALGLGAVAALLGAGLYFGIEAATGYELGLVAVVVGLMVGGAVRKGSNGRGGWRYQVLAMFLTYCAVVATDSSMIAREMGKRIQSRARGDSVAAVTDSGSARAASTATTPRPRERPGPLALIVGVVALLAFAFAAPILIGVASPIHLLIAGIALYEAWKLNKGVALRVTGPYPVAAGSAPP
jgi:hypothetical protein